MLHALRRAIYSEADYLILLLANHLICGRGLCTGTERFNPDKCQFDSMQ